MLLALVLIPTVVAKAQTVQSPAIYPVQCANITANVQIGSRDYYYGQQNVRILQAYLYSTGYLRVAPTGYFGGMTLAAVKSFQRNNSIYPTGTANAQTRSKIRDLSCNPTTPPNQTQTINLQLKDYNQVWGPNSVVRFTWTASYLTPYPFGAYLVNQNGVDVTSQYLGTGTSGESYVTLPSTIPSGEYKLFVVDETTNRSATIKSNVITLQVNGGVVNPGNSAFRIISPNGNTNRDDVYQGGQQVVLNFNMPSDRAYYVGYYLVPQSGTSVRYTNGTTYDSTVGGYALGGYQYNFTMVSPSLYVTLPADVYTGKYKLKIVLKDASTNVGVNSNPIIATDESDYAFMLYTYYQDGAPSSTPLRITSPNGGETVQAGGTMRVRVTMPSDKQYSLSYYLTPQSGTTVRTGAGTYYDATSGGYSLGGHVPSTASSGADNTISMPTDIPAGSYRLRVYLRNKDQTAGSPTPTTSISYYDSDAPFTVTNQNGGGTGTPTLRVTSPNTTSVEWDIGRSQTINWTSTNLDGNTGLTLSLRSSLGEICQIGTASAGAGSFAFTPSRDIQCYTSNGYYNTRLGVGYYKVHITTTIQTAIYPSTAPVDMSDEYFQIVDTGTVGLVTPSLSRLSPDWATALGDPNTTIPNITIYGSNFNGSSRVIVGENTTVVPTYVEPAGTWMTFNLPYPYTVQPANYRITVGNYAQYGDNRLSNSLYFRVWPRYTTY